ncbi:tetratricopeptide repeat-containing sensor histidine kinase [Algibacter sp. L4_22]|uniref:ATP-binding protein n=1 Tax=Algibacter sp. L4_22 TaxID=2942477 RepID=UPI00201B6B4A|nr:tetratricopeptide repeat-containing sensor histidine kinase [Algibacter sp. L4_22]MCL5127685.1 tetratricopeptide repeat-containing sensor histidine kinase [Algibacter sp. L4_22]
MQCILKIQHPKLSYTFIWMVFICFFNIFSAFGQEDVKKDLQRKIKTYQATSNFKQNPIYINLLYDLGLQYAEYNLDSLLIVSNESIKLSKTINYSKGEIQGYLIEGLYYSNIGKQDRAISCFSKALSKAEAISQIDLLLESKIKLAVEYKYKDNYAKALKQYLDAIEIAKRYNKDQCLSRCYVNISVIYRVQKEHIQTILYLTKALEVYKKDGDDVEVAKILNNLAACHIKTGDLKSATNAIDSAIPVFEKAKLDSWLSYAYELKGTVYIKKEKFNQALKWLNKSEEIHTNIDKRRYKIPLYLHLANTYLGLKRSDIAEGYALKALEISKALNILDGRDEILKILYKIKKANNSYEESLTYLEELKDISDTINKKNNIKELRILKSNLESEQEKEQYILESEQKQVIQRGYIYISVLIILAFLIIIIILKKNNKTQNVLNKKLIENTLALKKNEAHLNGANNTKNKLFSIIAHDLKGPINSFKSLFDLFNKSQLTTAEFMEFMPQIGQNINSIAFTLNNLLTWGQTQMNGLVTKPNYTTIKTLVDESIKLLSKQAEAKSITTINNIDIKVVTWSDKDQIDIVIRNLISNAVKFTRQQGTITIDASEKSDFWEIVVKDNGVGMNQEDQINIFKEEETVTSYGTSNEKGTGLGLRVCKEMVENNGGTIWVESLLNQGSSFYFTIPKTKTY